MTKRPGFPAIKPKFSAGGAFALLAGAGLLVASAFSFQDTHASAPVTVNPSVWSSLSHLQFGLDHADVSEEILLGLDTESFPQNAAALTFAKPLVVRKIQRARHVAAHRSPARVLATPIAQVAPVSPPAAPVTIQDQVSMVQSSAVVVEVTTTTRGAATTEQLEAFQKMHRLLRVQLMTALHTHTPAIASTLTIHPVVAASAPNAQSAMNTVSVAAPAPSTLANMPTAAQVDEDENAEEDSQVASIEQATPPTAPALTTVPVISPVTAVSQVEVLAPAIAQKVTTQPARVVTQPAIPPYNKKPLSAAIATSSEADLKPASVSSNPFASYDTLRKQSEGTYQELSALSQKTFASPEVTTQSMTPAPTPAVATQAVSSAQSLLVTSKSGYSKHVDYSTLDLYKMWQAWNARNQAAPVAPAAPKAPTPPAAPATTLAAVERPFQIAQAAEALVTATDAPPAVAPRAPSIVEGFEWNTAVENTTTEALTLEGWNRIQAPDHWPVIVWNPDAQSQAAMISHNTAVMLSKFADTQLQPDAAIVFGKIPMGWEVEYSDRAEKVIYLNAQNQVEATPENVRYFAFINAAPGAQVITLKGALGSETAAVVAPVLSGTSTYLDLTAVTKRAFSGYVLDAGAQGRKGIASASIGVVGQPNAVFFTTDSGYFHLSEVYAIGTYPVFVETTTPVGFKHRYRVAPGKMEGVDLYRLNDDQVRGWVSQLEGGVSPDSGLIVAAMPSLVQQYGDGRLFPSTRTLLGSTTLTPETYTLSSGGELEDGKPLEATAPRFISVQIPTGPVVSQVEDNNQNIVWSQLVLAQPGVISMVGPY